MLVLEFVDVDPFTTTEIWEGTLSISDGNNSMLLEDVDIWDFFKSFNSGIYNAWVFGGCYHISASGLEVARICADGQDISIDFYDMPLCRVSQTELGSIIRKLSSSLSTFLNDESSASSDKTLWYTVVPRRYWDRE